MSVRYLFSTRRERFVSVAGMIAMSGVAVGCAALIVVLAVMSGFGSELREKIVGTNMHLVVEGAQGMPYPTQLEERIADIPHVEGVAPFVAGEAVLRTDNRVTGVVIRGIDPVAEQKVTNMVKYLRGQIWELTPSDVLIGKELAAILGVRRGENLSLIAPVDGKRYDVTIGGIFDSGLYEYDVRLIYVHLSLAQRLFGLQSQVTGLGIRLDDVDLADDVAARVVRLLPPMFGVRTWMDMNRPFFAALELEKLAMFIILTLIVLVAAANIVSTLLMMVRERTKDIGILKSIGASNWSIWAIFTCEGLLIGLIGTVGGMALGMGICWLQMTYGLVRLPNTVYYLDVLPMQLRWMDTAIIGASAMLISLLMTWYPAWQASRLHPVEALRYE